MAINADLLRTLLDKANRIWFAKHGVDYTYDQHLDFLSKYLANKLKELTNDKNK